VDDCNRGDLCYGCEVELSGQKSGGDTGTFGGGNMSSQKDIAQEKTGGVVLYKRANPYRTHSWNTPIGITERVCPIPIGSTTCIR